MNNGYICDLQIVDIYQNIRPPPRHRRRLALIVSLTQADLVSFILLGYRIREYLVYMLLDKISSDYIQKCLRYHENYYLMLDI